MSLCPHLQNTVTLGQVTSQLETYCYTKHGELAVYRVDHLMTNELTM